jgi:BlaI family penicillinase repressor
MAPRIDVTEAERELLEALWRRGPLTPPSFFVEVKRRRDWSDSTIKTLLARLMRKKIVRSERVDGQLIYRPLIARDALVASLVDDLVERLFEGDYAELERFIQARRLTSSPTT